MSQYTHEAIQKNRCTARISALALIMLLGGCAGSLGTPTVGAAVQVQTPVSCIPAAAPAKPVFTDTPDALRAAPDVAARDALIKGNWFLHMAWEQTLEELVNNCK